MIQFAEDWKWSSYRETINQATISPWLNTDLILAGVGRTKGLAIEAYERFVSEGTGQPSSWLNLKNQVFIGSGTFVERISQQIDESKDLRDIPASQRRSIPKSLEYYDDNLPSCNAAIISAYKSGGYSMKEVGEYFGLSYSMVSRIIKDSKFKT